MLRAIVLIVLILAILGALPVFPWAVGWGYGPSGILGLCLLVAIVWIIVTETGGRPVV